VTWLFLQTWFWHLVAFLLGALITWVLFAKPWSRQRGAQERADSAASAALRDLAAARERVSSLEADLAACKKGRTEDHEASQREIGGLRIKLDRANAPAGAGVVGAERANEDITMTSDLTAVVAGLRAGPPADTSGPGAADVDATDVGSNDIDETQVKAPKADEPPGRTE
jgi:hypothetical protein